MHVETFSARRVNNKKTTNKPASSDELNTHATIIFLLASTGTPL